MYLTRTPRSHVCLDHLSQVQNIDKTDGAQGRSLLMISPANLVDVLSNLYAHILTSQLAKALCGSLGDRGKDSIVKH